MCSHRKWGTKFADRAFTTYGKEKAIELIEEVFDGRSTKQEIVS